MNERRLMVAKMLEETPRDSFLRYALALEEHKEGEIEAAIKRLKDLLVDDPGYLGAYYQLGKYLETSDHEQAVEVYKKGIAEARLQKADKMLRELSEALLWIHDDDE